MKPLEVTVPVFGVVRHQLEESPRPIRPHLGEAAEFGLHGFRADLADLVEDHERLLLRWGGDSGSCDERPQQLPVVQQDGEVREAEGGERRVQDHQRLRIGDQGLAADDVGVALGELPEPPALGAVGAPDRLDLVTAEHRG